MTEGLYLRVHGFSLSLFDEQRFYNLCLGSGFNSISSAAIAVSGWKKIGDLKLGSWNENPFDLPGMRG